MITIEAKGKIHGHKISWLYDADDEESAAQKAKQHMQKNGVTYIDYILFYC